MRHGRWHRWQIYIAEATSLERATDKTKVAAIIEKGRRSAEFHAAFKDEGQKWGTRWDEVCKDVIGITQQACPMYETIAGNITNTVCDLLPPDIVNLNYLARARRANKKAFDKAIKADDIHPEMTRKDAKDICEKFGGSLRRTRSGSRNRTPRGAGAGSGGQRSRVGQKEIKLGFLRI
jgi:hypothetical protein